MATQYLRALRITALLTAFASFPTYGMEVDLDEGSQLSPERPLRVADFIPDLFRDFRFTTDLFYEEGMEPYLMTVGGFVVTNSQESDVAPPPKLYSAFFKENAYIVCHRFLDVMFVKGFTKKNQKTNKIIWSKNLAKETNGTLEKGLYCVLKAAEDPDLEKIENQKYWVIFLKAQICCELQKREKLKKDSKMRLPYMFNGLQALNEHDWTETNRGPPFTQERIFNGLHNNLDEKILEDFRYSMINEMFLAIDRYPKSAKRLGLGVEEYTMAQYDMIVDLIYKLRDVGEWGAYKDRVLGIYKKVVPQAKKRGREFVSTTEANFRLRHIQIYPNKGNATTGDGKPITLRKEPIRVRGKKPSVLNGAPSAASSKFPTYYDDWGAETVTEEERPRRENITPEEELDEDGFPILSSVFLTNGFFQTFQKFFINPETGLYGDEGFEYDKKFDDTQKINANQAKQLVAVLDNSDETCGLRETFEFTTLQALGKNNTLSPEQISQFRDLFVASSFTPEFVHRQENLNKKDRTEKKVYTARPAAPKKVKLNKIKIKKKNNNKKKRR